MLFTDYIDNFQGECMKSLKLNTILNAFRMTLTVLVPLITFPYISRIFLAEGSGKINFVSSVIQIFTLFASLGFYTYGVREGAKVRNDREKFSKFGQEMLFINIIATAVTYVVFLACVFFLPAFQSYKVLLLIQGITIGFTALSMDWVFGVFEDYYYITVRQILCHLFIIATLFIFIHKSEDIYLYVCLHTFATAASCIFSIIYSRKYLFYTPRKDFDYHIVTHLSPIFALFATSLAAKVYTNIDTVLLGFMTADYNVGLYSAAVKINTVLITFFSAMSPVFMPRIISYIEKKDYDSYHSLLKRILGMIIGLGLPAVVGIEMLSDQIIRIIADDSFAPAAFTMRILAPIVLINACANVLYYDVLVIYKKEKSVLLCTVFGAVINLILSVILIPLFAEKGAAIGSIISEMATLLIAVIVCIKLDKRVTKAIPKIINYIIGGFLIAAWCALCTHFIENFILQTIVAIVGSVGLYFLALIVLRDFLGQEIVKQGKKFINKVFKKS